MVQSVSPKPIRGSQQLPPRSAEAALVRICGLSPEMAVALVHGGAVKGAEGELLDVKWGTAFGEDGTSGKGGAELMAANCGKAAAQGARAAEEALR